MTMLYQRLTNTKIKKNRNVIVRQSTDDEITTTFIKIFSNSVKDITTMFSCFG